MENFIRHEGIVESIDNGHVRVRITQHSACSACKIASHCTASESKEKVIDIFQCKRQDINVGDIVVVSTPGRSASTALLLGFGFPLIIMLFVIGILITTGIDEGIAAVMAIASLIPYYIVVWIFRNRISNVISFHIE
jgi:sigma-E factor negative regulatory protein RseC